MGLKQPELGIKSPLQRRVGIELDTWRGVNKEADPGAIGDSELQEAINCRITPSGEIVCRGGQERLLDEAFDDCVTMIFDDEWDPVGDLLYDSAVSGLKKATKNDSVSTIGIPISSGSESGRMFIVFRAELYAFNDNVLRSLDIPAAQSTVRLTIGSAADVATHINSATVFEDEMWLASSAGTLWRWDGQASDATEDVSSLGATSGNTHGAFVISYANDIYFASTDLLRRRAGGEWFSIPLPLTLFQPYDLVVYHNKLYLLGIDESGGGNRDPVILVYDGESVTVARSLPNAGTGSLGAVEGARAGVSFNGYLYYAWVDPSFGGGKLFIGRYNGTVWDDTHKDFFAQLGGDAHEVSRLIKANGRIYLGGPENQPSKVLHSPGVAVNGTWVVVDSATTGSRVAVDLVVYNG
jgi:hypothetical protein